MVRPVTTASNYFTGRDDLLCQAASRVYERFQPDGQTIAISLTDRIDREKISAAMREAVHRIASLRPEYLAPLELRLEATRRPEMQAALTRRAREDIAANVVAQQQPIERADATSV